MLNKTILHSKKAILYCTLLALLIFFPENLFASVQNFEDSVIENLISKEDKFTITYKGDIPEFRAELKQILKNAVRRVEQENVFVKSRKTSMKYYPTEAQVTFIVTYVETPEHTYSSEQELTDYIYSCLKQRISGFEVGFFAGQGQNPKKVAERSLKKANIQLEQNTKNLNIGSYSFNIASFNRVSKINFQISYIPENKYSEEYCETEQELTSLIYRNMRQRNPHFIIHFLGNLSGIVAATDKALETASSQTEYLKNNLKKRSFQSLRFGKSEVIEFDISYLTSKAQEELVDKETDKILDRIISSNMNVHEKEKAIHDYIVLLVAYDESKIHENAYDAIVKKRTVCIGYSLLAQKLFDKVGITSIIVSNDEMKHSWNMVRIRDTWYHLDITWDDPVPDQEGRIIYSYYNLTDYQMLNHPQKNHIWDRDKYPRANKEYQFKYLNRSK